MIVSVLVVLFGCLVKSEKSGCGESWFMLVCPDPEYIVEHERYILHVYGR